MIDKQSHINKQKLLALFHMAIHVYNTYMVDTDYTVFIIESCERFHNEQLTSISIIHVSSYERGLNYLKTSSE